MLKQRVITGLILGLTVVGALLLLPEVMIGWLMVVVTSLAALEYAELVGWNRAVKYIFVGIVFLLPAAILLGFGRISGPGGFLLLFGVTSIIGVMYAVGAAIGLWIYSRSGKRPLWDKIGFTLLSIVMGCWFIPFALTMLLLLNVSWGYEIVCKEEMFLLLLLQVATNDTMAYFVGRTFGKHPLAPKISPKKTVEGMLGGIVSSVLVTWCYFQFTERKPKAILCLLGLTVVVSLFAVIGDLFESMLKRKAGVKDSGKLLPGHGGVYDRIDSLMAAVPVFVLGGLVIMVMGGLQ